MFERTSLSSLGGAVSPGCVTHHFQLLCKVNVLEDYGWEVGIWMEKLRQGQHLELVRLLLESVKLVLSDPNGLNSEVMRCVTAHGAAGGVAGLNLRGKRLWLFMAAAFSAPFPAKSSGVRTQSPT